MKKVERSAENRFKTTCPLCGKVKVYQSKQWYSRMVEKFGDPSKVVCKSCNHKRTHIRARLPTAVCPDCGEERQVSQQTYRNAVAAGAEVITLWHKVVYRCRTCGMEKRNEERRIAKEQEVEIKGAVEINGCTIVEKKGGGRCEEYAECKHFMDCLNFVNVAQWNGWRKQTK